MFQCPNIGIAKAALESGSAGRDVYLYHFEEPPPFPSPTEGLSYHGLCALLIYLHQLERLSEDVKRTSLEAAGAFAVFASGEKTWGAFGDAGRFMRWGPGVFRGCMILRVIGLGGMGHIQWMEGHFEEAKAFGWSILLA